MVESSFFAALLDSTLKGSAWGLKLTVLPQRKGSQDTNRMGGFWTPDLAWALWRKNTYLPYIGNRNTVPRMASLSLTRYSYRNVAASEAVCPECQIYRLTPRNGVLVEKLTVRQLFKKCLVLYAIPVFSTVSTKGRRLSLT